MEQVTALKTSDGKLFESDADAKAHQAELDFNAWYQNDRNQLLGNYMGSYVDLPKLKDWLRENRVQVLSLLAAK